MAGASQSDSSLYHALVVTFRTVAFDFHVCFATHSISIKSRCKGTAYFSIEQRYKSLFLKRLPRKIIIHFRSPHILLRSPLFSFRSPVWMCISFTYRIIMARKR